MRRKFGGPEEGSLLLRDARIGARLQESPFPKERTGSGDAEFGTVQGRTVRVKTAETGSGARFRERMSGSGVTVATRVMRKTAYAREQANKNGSVSVVE